MEQKSNSSLMKKTKAELVGIILRKDEREKELLSQISIDKTKDTTILQQKDEINRLKDELDNKKKTNERLGATIKACEENIEDRNELINKYKIDIEDRDKVINDLKTYINDYQEGCDSCVTQTQIKLDNINFYKIYGFIVSILFIIAMVILIFF
ncbi:MAG: autophagy protein 16 [Bacteriophage sp.]|nr:MAG: autophagy protein 16 [Bacteriophage sp.]